MKTHTLGAGQFCQFHLNLWKEWNIEWTWWELVEYKSTCVTITISILQYVPFLSWVRWTLTQQIGLLTMYAILDKMLRQMGVTLSSFKIKLLKALATTDTPLPLLPHQKNDVELQLDLFWPQLISCDQGGGRGGAIVVPNPRHMHSVGRKVQNS